MAIRALAAAAWLALGGTAALAALPAIPPGAPSVPVLSGSGAPAAGSGVPSQLYIDTAGHAYWLNTAGTWVQIGIWNAPTAPPIPPPASSPGGSVNFSVAGNSALVAALGY